MLVFLGFRRNLNPIILALLVGFCTGIRLVGVALLPPLFWHLWRQRSSCKAYFAQLMLLGPLSVWGIVAYMIFLQITFHEPMAFAKAQEQWQFVPNARTTDHILCLVSFEPWWGFFDPDSASHYSRIAGGKDGLLSGAAMDRIVFAAAIALLFTGLWNQILSIEEALLCVGLIGIGYVGRSYEMCFFSQGRFVSVAFPLYMVAGRILSRLPTAVALAILLTSALLQSAYFARFVAGYTII